MSGVFLLLRFVALMLSDKHPNRASDFPWPAIPIPFCILTDYNWCIGVKLRQVMSYVEELKSLKT